MCSGLWVLATASGVLISVWTLKSVPLRCMYVNVRQKSSCQRYICVNIRLLSYWVLATASGVLISVWTLKSVPLRCMYVNVRQKSSCQRYMCVNIRQKSSHQRSPEQMQGLIKKNKKPTYINIFQSKCTHLLIRKFYNSFSLVTFYRLINTCTQTNKQI